MSKTKTEKKAITTSIAKLVLEEPQIIRAIILEGADFEVLDVKEMLEKSTELANGKKYCYLADVRSTTARGSKEARAYAADNQYQKNRIADAIIVRTTATKLLANFYIQFHKPKVKTRMFTNEEQAMEWLKSKLS